MSDVTKKEWQAYKAAPSIEKRNQIVEVYVSYARSLACRYKLTIPAYLGDTVDSGAMLGLIAAVEGFDPNERTSFTTYAFRRISGAMVDAIRSEYTSRKRLDRRKRDSEAIEELTKKKGRPVTDDELAQRNVRPPSLSGRPVRMFWRGSSGEWISNDPAYVDAMADFERQEMWDQLDDLLSVAQKFVVYSLYVLELNQREIAKALGVSQQRVSTLKVNALDELRYSFGEELEDVWRDK